MTLTPCCFLFRLRDLQPICITRFSRAALYYHYPLLLLHDRKPAGNTRFWPVAHTIWWTLLTMLTIITSCWRLVLGAYILFVIILAR